MHDPYSYSICSRLELLCCDVVRSRCFSLLQSEWQPSLHPLLDLVLPRISFFRRCSPNTPHLLFCFAWVIQQFVEIFFPPFPYLCLLREYSATLVLFLRLYCSCLVVGSVIFHLVVYSSYELLFILLGVLFGHST